MQLQKEYLMESIYEMFRAEAHITKHAFSYANSMVLLAAIQLNIPDIIHSHGKPITIPELVSALKLPPHKSNAVYPIMSLLTHNGFFHSTKLNGEEEEEIYGYVLTSSSRLLLKSEIPNLSPIAQLLVQPAILAPCQILGDWLSSNNEKSSLFETAHGIPFWEFCDKNSGFNKVFYETLAAEIQMLGLVVKDYGHVFEGMSTLVDVGGGNGMFAKVILEAFPSLKCTVFDLPHAIVESKHDGNNLQFVQGSMFDSIPSADAIIFKNILHNWNDENCVKILKKSREAIITSNKNNDNNGVVKGKVIVIDIILGIDKDNEDSDRTEVKLMCDFLMMVVHGAKERNEKEWERLLIDSGFTHYKITPIFGYWSIIELFP